MPIYFVYSYNSFKNAILTPKEQILEVKKWETYRSFAEKFDLNANYLKVYLKLNPPKHDLQAGNYKLEKWLNLTQVINSLKDPVANDKQITILEWWNIYDIDNLLEKSGYIKTWELIAINKEKLADYKKEYKFLAKAETLEWFLYPDTYSINPNNFKLEVFVKTMLSNFDTKVIKELEIKANDADLQNNLILASIVEKEEKSVKEKATVAWVLKKRMVEKWFIWASLRDNIWWMYS